MGGGGGAWARRVRFDPNKYVPAKILPQKNKSMKMTTPENMFFVQFALFKYSHGCSVGKDKIVQETNNLFASVDAFQAQWC